MPFTRASRYRIPPSEFKDNDFVIKIDPPKDPVFNKNTPTNPAPSLHTDDNRFGRHRQHLLQEYGQDKFKFEGHDDFMDAEEDHMVVSDVYGWYEVSEWPGAKERLEKTMSFLKDLKGEEHITSDSSPTSFDDEKADQTFEGENKDEGPLLPSEAQTIEEDMDGAIYVPSPGILRQPNFQQDSPVLGDFTPTQPRQRRPQNVKIEKQNRNDAKVRRQAYNESITRTSPIPNHASIQAPARRNNGLDIIALLDQRVDLDVTRGKASPTTKRYYPKYELKARRQSQQSQAGKIDAVLLGQVDQSTEPTYRTQRGQYNTKKRKSQASLDDGEGVNRVPIKKRKSTRLSQIPIYNDEQQHELAQVVFRQDPTQPKVNEKIYPIIRDPNAQYSLWPQCADEASSLPEAYQVRVRFIANAQHILPKYAKEQAQGMEIVIQELEKSVYYYLLTLPGWRTEAMRNGTDGLKSQARKFILSKMQIYEDVWVMVFNNLNVNIRLPGASRDQICPLTAPLRQHAQMINGEASANNNFPHNDHMSHTTFLTKLFPLIHRQSSALLETIRFQTSTPPSLQQQQSSQQTRERKLYESNMRLAALGWQTHFFESWVTKVGRDRARSVQQALMEGRGEVRFWHQEVPGGRIVNGEKEAEVVDLLAGVRYSLQEWQKQIQSAGKGDGYVGGEGDEEEEEGAIAKAIRRASESDIVDAHVNTFRRRPTAHERLQAAVNADSPDRNVAAHYQLKDELRRRSLQEEERRNRCSQQQGYQQGQLGHMNGQQDYTNGQQDHLQPQQLDPPPQQNNANYPQNYASSQVANGAGPGLFQQSAITHMQGQRISAQQQWALAQGLPVEWMGHAQIWHQNHPRNGARNYANGGVATTHVPGPVSDYQPHASPLASVNANGFDINGGAVGGGMPIDPALQAIDTQMQQQAMLMRAQEQRTIRERQETRMQMRIQQQPLTPLRPHSYAQNGYDGQMSTHGQLFTSPGGTAGVRLSSSPLRGEEAIPSIEAGGEDEALFFPSSPLSGAIGRPNSPATPVMGPSSPLDFAAGMDSDDNDELEQEFEDDDELEQTDDFAYHPELGDDHGVDDAESEPGINSDEDLLQQEFEDNYPYDVNEHIVHDDDDPVADPYETQETYYGLTTTPQEPSFPGMVYDHGGFGTLTGGSVNDANLPPMVSPASVNGDFGANELGETGETEGQASARGEGDGWWLWKGMLGSLG